MLYIYSLMSFVVDNQDLFQANSSVNCIKTRQRDQFNKPYVALSCIQKCATFSSIKISNALPQSLVKLKTEKLRFKNALRRFLTYHSFYTLEDFFSSNSNIILQCYFVLHYFLYVHCFVFYIYLFLLILNCYQ
jgi:hypothetical protein